MASKPWGSALLMLCSSSAAVAQESAPPAETPAAEAGLSEVSTIPVDAAADGAPPEGTAAERAGGRIQEIVVTAQKREENLQDVPIAISAFSAEQLEAKGAESTRSLAQITPGLTMTEFAGYIFTYLRGVGSDIFIPSADPSVAYYLDGIYTPIAHGFAQELAGVERVEVLKGPQGTLFGRNSNGGAISITTRKPGDDVTVDLGGSLGDYDTFSARGSVDIPLLDSLALGVSGLTRGSSSYYRREVPGRPELGIPDDRASGFRVRLRWNPTDNSEFLLTGQRVSSDIYTSLVVANHYVSLLGAALTMRPTEGDYVTEENITPQSNSYGRNIYGQFSVELPWFDIKLLGSDQYYESHDATDFDGTSVSAAAFDGFRELTDIQTGELQIISNKESWGSDWLTWVGGLYYLESHAGFDPASLRVAHDIVQLPTGEIYDLLPPPLRDLLGGVPLPNDLTIYLEGLLDTKSASAFFQTTAQLTDWMSLTLGGRYQREKRAQVRSTASIIRADGSLFPLTSFPHQSKTLGNFSPKVTLDFRPMDDVLVYASWARGFKSATYNIVNIYQPPTYVKPEELTSYELGVKSTLFDGSARINAAIFHNKTKDLQSAFVSLLAGGAIQLENAGSARSRGVEADILWLPMPNWNPDLQLTLGAAYVDAIYTSFKDGSGFDETTGLFEDGQDFSGNRVTRTPKWTGSASVSQNIPVGPGQIELGVDWYYSGSFYFLPQNQERSYEPSYDVLGARIGYFIEPWDLRVTAFGTNLTNEKYDFAQLHSDFGRSDTQAPPRMWGVRAQWSF